MNSPLYDTRTRQDVLTLPNVIILTSGLTGSSVLTGLISRAGYWTGATHKKPTYDTYENAGLVELNRRLVSAVGESENYVMGFGPAVVERMAALYETTDLEPYRAFIQSCNTQRPWVWKDPRLTMTIRFWKNLLPLDQSKFIILTRDYMQCWISEILRGQIKTYRYSKSYEQRIEKSSVAFCDEIGAPHLHVRYEELIVHPDKTVQALNGFLNTSLTLDDLRAVYRKGLYKTPRRSALDHVKAMCIYAKHYPQRLDIATDRGGAR